MKMLKIFATIGAAAAMLAIPTCAESTIPEDAAEFEGHFYKVFALDYYEIEQKVGRLGSVLEEVTAYCASLGGYPAAITTAEEDAFVYDYISGNGIRSAFMGLTNLDINGDGDTTTWKWVNGEEFNYANWGIGEPEEDEYKPRWYGMYYYEDGTWHAGYEPNRGMTFICEWGEIEETVQE